MDNTELEDLDQLVNSDGWHRFVEMVQKDWGPAGERYVNAVNATMKVGDEITAVQQMRQVIVAQREIMAVVNAPANRIRQLKQASAMPEVAYIGSRRGGL